MTSSRNGFTLVELMITLAMTGIIVAAVYSTYTVQQRAYGKQEQVAEIQQNLRAAIYNMAQEIRMAGYNPEGNANAGFEAAGASSMTFTMDLNENDTIGGDPGERVTYALNNGNVQRNNQVLAANIEKLEFWYTLEDNSQTLTPGNLPDIRAVTISILGRAERKDSSLTHAQEYESASGVDWTPAGGEKQYRRRLFITTVQCRNMGL